MVNAPWYVRNNGIHKDLQVNAVSSEIQRFAQSTKGGFTITRTVRHQSPKSLLEAYSKTLSIKGIKFGHSISVYAEEKLFYDKILKMERALCKLRKKCRQNLKFVSDVEVDTLTEDISTSLCRRYQII